MTGHTEQVCLKQMKQVYTDQAEGIVSHCFLRREKKYLAVFIFQVYG